MSNKLISNFDEQNVDIAHVRKCENGWDSPHILIKHLEGTAKLAGKFAGKFYSDRWGEVLGLAHDAGKGRPIWQKYIRSKNKYDEEAHLEGKPGKIPHAIYGARMVEEQFGVKGRFLAYCIAGHHTGLPDWVSGVAPQSSLKFQYQKFKPKELEEVPTYIRSRIQSFSLTNPPWKFSCGMDSSLWIRMLYSCLVDADFLDTESYMDSERASDRGIYSSISDLLMRYNRFIKKFEERSEKSNINKIRQSIRAKCTQKAREPQGIFSLTVPTGGGKTLSSLAFALIHATTHQMDRIIYVIPYTSIIEQNTNVFRQVLGTENVVEHHSTLDEKDSTMRTRLACENWDAPFIVTTNVQFFESLFSAKSSRCRKLHNIVNSVIILDEAQLLPVELLGPILKTMQLLVDRYHVTFVIATATQPAFGKHDSGYDHFPGLVKINEIMDDIPSLFDSLKRVDIKFPQDLKASSSLEEIRDQLIRYEQVLCIVSDRKSCRELYKLMPEGSLHLSALMCGEHRSRKIEEIKRKLKKGETVRVISTQLVEAGVDIDFPIVFRSLSGLDSIAQAAGRCNREGKLPEHGKVIVFNPPRKTKPGILRKAEETTRSLVSTAQGDPLNQEVFERYFSQLYWKANSLDSKGLIPLLSPSGNDLSISFRTASKKFRIIDDSMQKTIIVKYGEGVKLINDLKLNGPSITLMRKLQRYTVSVYNHDFEQMLKRGSIEESQPNIFALTSELEYRDDIGLVIEENLYDAEVFIQ